MISFLRIEDNEKKKKMNECFITNENKYRFYRNDEEKRK